MVDLHNRHVIQSCLASVPDGMRRLPELLNDRSQKVILT